MNVTDLPIRLEAYLALREALGYATHATRRLLQDFVAYLEQHSDGYPIRAHLAVDWACRASATRGLSGQHSRLSVARGFLLHLKARLPETEVPERHLMAAPRRPYPYLFSATDISRGLDGAGRLSPRGSLRPWTHQTSFGLLACTGLRPREARNLLVPDVQLDEQPPRLLIRETKFHKSRWVPLHPTAAEHLRRYAHLRHAMQYDALSEVFFLSEQGRHLDLHTLHRTFQRLIHRLGITPQPGQRRPTLHSLRQTFAVNRLRQWYEAGVEARAVAQSVGISGPPQSSLQLLVSDRHAGTAGRCCTALRTVRRERRHRMKPHTTQLGPLLQHFFVEYLGTQKRASPQTIASYRDTFRL